MAEDKKPFDTMNKMATMIANRRPTFLGGKGVTMMQLLMHNKAAGNPVPGMRNVANPNQLPQEDKIHSSHPEALKKAMTLLGLQSESNKHGIPISIDNARKMFHGDNKLSDVEESEFRAMMLNGDNAFDRKKMRLMTNYDGSTTYELLNGDKTVMSKFTFGSFQDGKVFSQGGYDEYAQQLRLMLEDGKKQTNSQIEFDELIMKMKSTTKERESRFGGEEVFSESWGGGAPGYKGVKV